MARISLRLAHTLNMANDAYAIVKALRRNGLAAELIINSADFGMGLPMWEDLEIEMDPYKIDFEKLLEKYDLPEWIKIWWSTSPNSHLLYSLEVIGLFKIASEYDYLHCHTPSSMFLQFSGKPFIVHEAGWIRSLVRDDRSVEKLGRRSYAKARCVVMTNPDTYPMLFKLQYRREEFIPFVIDPNQYKPHKVDKKEDLLFFHPARHVWDVKGNQKLIHAFAKFIQEGYAAKLRMVDWGWAEDTSRSKSLIENLNIREHIEWVPPYSKPSLIKTYNESDAVFDQFILGSGGTACYEALSCGKPVVIYLNEWNQKCFGEMPPVENCHSVDQIFKAMVRLTDARHRRDLGKRGRQFIYRHNHPDVVAKHLIQLYGEVFQ